jgi:pimeloyl-ACP methyl ester carboxylesterase
VRRTEIVVDGLRTPVVETGAEGAEEAVVLVHGNPGSAADWAGLQEALAPLARTVAPEMPGFGRAERPRDWPYDVAAYGRHLGATLDALGVRRAHLVLHDFGGPWGLTWAVHHPERVGSYTLVNTVAVMEHWHLLARLWRVPVLGEVAMATTTRGVFRALLRFTDPGLAREHADRMHAAFDRGTRRAVLRLYRATDPVALTRAVGPRLREQRDVPARVVWGTRDRYLPRALAERQREALPQADVVLVEGAGHWVMLERPAEVAAAVAEHLSRALVAA